MSSPIDRLLSRLLPRPAGRGSRRPISIFTPRRVAVRLRPLESWQLTLACPESLETRQLWSVNPVWDPVGNIL